MFLSVLFLDLLHKLQNSWENIELSFLIHPEIGVAEEASFHVTVDFIIAQLYQDVSLKSGQ